MTRDGKSTGTSNRTRIPLIVLVILALLVFGGIIVDQKTQPTLISGPMVQIPEPDALTIVWEMDAAFPGGAVRLTGPQGPELVEEVTPANGRYEATFKGLLAGTGYSYSVVNHGFLGREIVVAGPFKTATAPPRGRPFRFLAFGDSGVGSYSQQALADLMTEQNPDLIIHAGDLDQSTGDPENYLTSYFQPYAALIRSVPFLSVVGNHDCATDFGRPLLNIFVLPRNGPDNIEPERNFWFDFGDARFVGLDSNKIAGKQSGVLTPEQMKTIVAPWLREVLTDCDARWKFAYFHHPFYTGCTTHTPDGAAYVKEAYVSVFEECGVDIVFSGHNHLYERSAPILHDAIVDVERGGVVYVTTGAGGAGRYPMSDTPPDYNVVYNDKCLSFTQVDLTADRLELRQIGDNGQTIDEYVIEKTAGRSDDNHP
ncbi:MAG: metallophosphoesterase [Phycisphaerae bacterium]|nr:metallophosphoesterase [Phycisphaerae bacterium]